MCKKVKKIMALGLTIAMCVSNIGVARAQETTTETGESSNQAEEAVVSDVSKELADMELTYRIAEQWDKHYNVEVTLENVTDKKIDNWEIDLPANYEIENIWNAEISDSDETMYTIHNARWNQDISENGKVSFGMTVKAENKPTFPEYVTTNTICYEVDQVNYEMSFKVHSNWDNKINGQIVITNKGDKKIEDWNVSLQSNFKLKQIWNASIEYEEEDEKDNFYDLWNPGYNQNIEPKQSVEFGFIAECEGKPELSNFELYEMTSDFELDDYEEDEKLEFVDDFILDSDYFETREEYEKYLEEHGYEDDALIETGSSENASRKSRAKAVDSTVLFTAKDMMISETARATQHYLPISDRISYLMSAEKSNVNVVKRTEDTNGGVTFSEPTKFEQFGHGQTFEQFTIPNRGEFFLLAGGCKDKFAKKLAIMPRSLFEKRVVSQTMVKFELWNRPADSFQIMTGLACANKSGKKSGDLYRTDAAISADGSILVIWKELQGGTQPKQEISLYNMNKLIKIYDAQRKQEQKKAKNGTLKKDDENKSLALSFAGKKKKQVRNACIGSFSQQSTKKKQALFKPNNSFQAIDVENYVENGQSRWRIVITSGNEINETKQATISRIEVKMDKKKAGKLSYSVFRNHVALKAESTGKLELEGGHIMGKDKFEFVCLKGSGKDKTTKKTLRKQYFGTIDLMDIKTKIK